MKFSLSTLSCPSSPRVWFLPMQALHDEMKECNRCALRSGCKQVIPGEGETNASVVFLGEAPGEIEDEQGVPFIGRAGILLRSELKKAGIEEFYVSNIVRCRPPGNRDPHPIETEACWPFTLKTLQQIRPKVVVSIGRQATDFLSYKLKIKLPAGGFVAKQAGKRVYVPSRRFYLYPVLHPSYALRRREARKEFSAQIQYLGQALPNWLRRTS